MLMLTRRPKEEIVLDTSDGRIRVVFQRFRDGKARLGIEAPKSVKVLRHELLKEGQNDERGTH